MNKYPTQKEIPADVLAEVRRRVLNSAEDYISIGDVLGEIRAEWKRPINRDWSSKIARILIEERPALADIIRTRALRPGGKNKAKPAEQSDLDVVLAHLPRTVTVSGIRLVTDDGTEIYRDVRIDAARLRQRAGKAAR